MVSEKYTFTEDTIVESGRGLYVINLNGPLIRGLIKTLDMINFLPVQDESTENV